MDTYRLYRHKNAYDHDNTDDIFMKAVRSNVTYHKKNCKTYAKILKHKGVAVNRLKDITELKVLPPIPTLYLKYHRLSSMSDERMLIKATSSGTKGKRSSIGYNMTGLFYGAHMVLRIASYHKLLSIKPTNYIILGYEPNKKNEAIISKTAFGSTYFAPAIKRDYALRYRKDAYKLDLNRLIKRLKKYSRLPFPVRLVGFPSYMYFFLQELKNRGITMQLPKGSMVMLGGGWKQFYTEKVEKEKLYQEIKEILGIDESNVREFFGAVEHPMIYCDCKNHHFHVPTYSRVIIRDVDTLQAVENGTVGLLNLITPMLHSMPVVSVITDDLAILHPGKDCGCGIETPYFEILGRVGVEDIKTCAAGAQEMLQGVNL